MKREIKFRGKRTDNGEWVYGNLIKESEDCCISTDDIGIELDDDYWANSYGYPPSSSDFHITNIYEVISKTVGQFTGLLDKNGVEIYEGDIFKYRKHDGYLLPDFTGEVLFRMGSFGYVATSGNMGEAFTSFSEIDELHEDFLDHIEVIGNIHDKARQKQALIDMMRGDEEIGLYDDNPKNHGYER